MKLTAYTFALTVLIGTQALAQTGCGKPKIQARCQVIGTGQVIVTSGTKLEHRGHLEGTMILIDEDNNRQYSVNSGCTFTLEENSQP